MHTKATKREKGEVIELPVGGDWSGDLRTHETAEERVKMPPIDS